MHFSRRRNHGSGLVETAAGLILVIPVLLCLIDVAALVLTQTANDSLAKQCARAAAEAADAPTAATNATTTFLKYADSGLIKKQGVTTQYPTNGGPPDTVRCDTTIVCQLPVPVPFGGPAQQVFQAYSVEPIVGAAP